MAGAQERKRRSLARLRAEGVPVLDSLPVIETVEESLRRDTATVGVRAMALAAVAMKAEGHAVAEPAQVRAVIDDMIQQYGLAGAFTPEERAFIDSDGPDEGDRVQFTWRYECYWTLLWALGFVEGLGRPSNMCDPAVAMRILRDQGRERFLATADLRPQEALLDETDLIYRYHWAVVSAHLRGEQVEGLHAGVVMERHYALNWLIGYGGQAWDDISTDT